jgi:hypothetical protein
LNYVSSSTCGSACSKDDGRFSTPATPGREVALVGGGEDLDTRAAFLD